MAHVQGTPAPQGLIGYRVSSAGAVGSTYHQGVTVNHLVPLPPLYPPPILSSAVFGTTAALKSGQRTLYPAAIPSSEVSGTTQALGPGDKPAAIPDPIPTEEAFGPVEVVSGHIVEPDPVPSSEAFGNHRAVGPPNTRYPSAILSSEAFGTHAIVSGQDVHPDPVPSSEAFGPVEVVQGAPDRTIRPAPIPSSEAFGIPSRALEHPEGVPEIASHCDLAVDRLATEWRGLPKIEDWLCVFADACQRLEVALSTVLQYRSLDTARGVQQDRIGELDGEAREGRGDPDYRRFLKAGALVVASHGRPEELLEILVTLDNGFDVSAVHLLPRYPAGLIMTCKVPPGAYRLGESFARVLRRAVPSAVRLVLHFEEVGPPLFAWEEQVAEGDPAPAPGTEWEEDDALGVGGIWAEAI